MSRCDEGLQKRIWGLGAQCRQETQGLRPFSPWGHMWLLGWVRLSRVRQRANSVLPGSAIESRVSGTPKCPAVGPHSRQKCVSGLGRWFTNIDERALLGTQGKVQCNPFETSVSSSRPSGLSRVVFAYFTSCPRGIW